MGRRKAQTSEPSGENRIHDVIMKIVGLDFEVTDLDPDLITEERFKELLETIERMSKTIWIDKTYVMFSGSIWKDAFIYEDKWYDMIELVKPIMCGKKISKMAQLALNGATMVISLSYMYSVLDHLGFDRNSYEITINPESKYRVEYIEDIRKSWEY